MTETFIRNCWYVAATTPELGQSLLGRTLLDQPVVMYRREDGTPVALEDRCAHRFLPSGYGSAIPPLPMKASYPISGATRMPAGPASSAIRCI